VFFSRKQKNRRLGREHVLDVKLRSSQVRAARMRLVASAGSVSFAIVFGFYVLWRSGDWVLNRLVYENKSFSIQNLDVQTDGVVAINQLCRWAGLRPNQNLLALDLSQVKRNLELVPLVQSVSVERVLPRTLRIRVVEREPIAQVNVLRQRPGGGIETTLFQLDPDGYVMLPLDGRQRAIPPNTAGGESLPVISGLDPRELQPGRSIEAPQLQAALQLVIAFQQSPMAGLADLKWIDITSPEVLVVKTGQDSEITFGLLELEQQLRRWREVFDLGQKMAKAIATMDLAVTNSVPVRWQDPDGLSPATPKPSKPLRIKKKHV
jgi:cell division septal protein FtsQ